MKKQLPNRPLRRSFNLQKNSARAAAFLLILFGFLNGTAYSQVGTWTKVTALAPHANNGVMILLSDGRVMCKTNSGGDTYGNTWDFLTPDASGSYINGTWSSSAPSISTRLYFSSDVMKDGRVYVAGGEYGSGGSKGEVYDPVANTWTACPNPGTLISDANSQMLETGQVLESFEGSQVITKFYNPTPNTYTAGPNVHGSYDEACWVKLPDQSIVYVDINSTNSERYIPSLNVWNVDAKAPVNLYDPYGEETGPGFLLPNGQVFFFGSPSTSAYYVPSGNTSLGSWITGPTMPNNSGCPDAPGALMPNGKILIATSPKPTSSNHFPTPMTLYEFDYTNNTFTAVPAPAGGATTPISSYQAMLLDLPNGQVMYAQYQQSNSNQYYIYTPVGAQVSANRPVVNNVTASSCSLDAIYTITGTGFNGNSEGSVYGDDWQMATDWPIVKLTSGSNVYYCRSFNWNHTTPMSGSLADTAQFTLPAGLPLGTYELTVVTNGITSDNFSFTPGSGTPPKAKIKAPNGLDLCPTGRVNLAANSGSTNLTYQWQLNGSNIVGATSRQYTATVIGTYTVVVSNPCGSTTSKGVTVVKSCRLEEQSTNITSDAISVYPNPASLQTNVNFSIAEASHVIIKVYDMNGKEIQTLMDADMQQGNQSISVNTKDFAKGVYFVRMISGAGIQNVKLVVQ